MPAVANSHYTYPRLVFLINNKATLCSDKSLSWREGHVILDQGRFTSGRSCASSSSKWVRSWLRLSQRSFHRDPTTYIVHTIYVLTLLCLSSFNYFSSTSTSIRISVNASFVLLATAVAVSWIVLEYILNTTGMLMKIIGNILVLGVYKEKILHCVLKGILKYTKNVTRIFLECFCVNRYMCQRILQAGAMQCKETGHNCVAPVKKISYYFFAEGM